MPREFAYRIALLMLAGCFALSAGCASDGDSAKKDGTNKAASDAMYFESPQQAVPAITKMLEAKDWPRLAKHYDLSGSNIDRAMLDSGEFFYTDKRPDVAHPAGFWRYKHPFAPPFRYHGVEPTGDPNVTRVNVMVEIDQGGGLVQRGLDHFLMRKSAKGWQVLPGKMPG